MPPTMTCHESPVQFLHNFFFEIRATIEMAYFVILEIEKQNRPILTK